MSVKQRVKWLVCVCVKTVLQLEFAELTRKGLTGSREAGEKVGKMFV